MIKKVSGPISRVEIVGGDGSEISGSSGLVTNDIVHLRVHSSMMFHGGYSASVNNNNSLDVRFVTGTKEVHFSATAISGAQAQLYVYEGSNISGGTPVSLYNMRRSATNIAESKAYSAPSVTAVGVPLINGRLLPGSTNPSNRVGGEARSGTEWILKPSTSYLLRITNVSGSATTLSFVFEFYEENEG